MGIKSKALACGIVALGAFASLCAPEAGIAQEQAAAAPTAADAALAVKALSALATEMIEMSEKDADLQKGSVAKAMEVVDKKVMPLLDKERLAKRALGRYWREATPEQRERLGVAIPRLLGKTYAKALFSLKGSTVEFAAPRAVDGIIKVSAKVSSKSSQPMQISFAVAVEGGKIQIQDVVMEGVSLMGAFASNFAQVASQKGIDGLIKEIEAKIS